MRSADPEKLARLDAAFQKAVSDALERENKGRLQGDALTVEVKSVGKRPPGRSDPDASLLRNVGAAMQAVGIEPRFYRVFHRRQYSDFSRHTGCHNQPRRHFQKRPRTE